MLKYHIYALLFPGGSDSKEFSCNTEDLGLIPGSGRSPGERNSYPLQYFEDFPGGSDGREKKKICLQCRIPRTEEPGELQSVGLQRVGHD